VTEGEWLSSSHTDPMLSYWWENGGERKPRLLATCFFRRAVARAGTLTLEELDELNFDLVDRLDLADRIAEGLAPSPDVQEHNDEFYDKINPVSSHFLDRAAHHVVDPSAWEAVSGVCSVVQRKWDTAEESHSASLIRDIFGNPFRPVTLDPRWQSETVVSLATGIYSDRAFDRMPILADALEDAGCDNPDVLNHCRGDGPHVRGCWVVDLVLGKE
jgi:hypothetical protein